MVVSANKIRKLADQGLSAIQIVAKLGCSRMTVARRLAEAYKAVGLAELV